MKLVLAFSLLVCSFLAQAKELKVLSWNVYMVPQPAKFTHQGKRSEEIARQLSQLDYDILLFQEAFDGGFRKKMEKALGDTYPHSHYLKKRGLLPLVGSGLFVMSKHPYKVLENIYFNDCKAGDCHAKKGASFIEVELPGKKLMQFGLTHLQSGRAEKKQEVRQKQLKQIKEALQRIQKPGVPQFLAGDLNIDYNNSEAQEFALMTDLLEMNTAPLSGDLDYTGGFPIECYSRESSDYKWIDHMLIDNRTRDLSIELQAREFHGPIKDKMCPLSDHHALEAIIQLPQEVSDLN